MNRIEFVVGNVYFTVKGTQLRCVYITEAGDALLVNCGGYGTLYTDSGKAIKEFSPDLVMPPLRKYACVIGTNVQAIYDRKESAEMTCQGTSMRVVEFVEVRQ